MAEKWVIGNVAVEERERDRFRKLRRAETYRNLKTEEPHVRDHGVYTVELTPTEIEDLRKNPPSNLRYMEKVPPGSKPNVDNAVPSDADLRGAKADKLYEWGFTGRGIDVGIIDTGLGSGIASKFNIKAIRGEQGLTPYHGAHGSWVASLAVPRASQLVFARAIDESGESNFDGSDEVSALYWMVDTIGVHVINMSFGGGAGGAPWQTAADAIAHAISKGVLMVASAGNDSSSSPQYPANYNGVVAVGSLDAGNGWARASHSNYGPWVDLWANGVSVTTYNPDGSITRATGTSFAAPLVTFVKASLLTKGLNSIGQIQVQRAVREGDGREPVNEDDPGPALTGGVDDPGPVDSNGQPRYPKVPAQGVPPGVGGGKRLNGAGAAWRMRDLC